MWQSGTEKPRLRDGALIANQRTKIVIAFVVPSVDGVFYVASSSEHDLWMLDNFARQFQRFKFDRLGTTVEARWLRKMFTYTGREFYIAVDRGKNPDGPFHASWLSHFYRFEAYVIRYTQSRWFRFCEQTAQLYAQLSGDDD